MIRETPKPKMAKADLGGLTLREKRGQYGDILRRAREIAGFNRDEAADALNVDPAQISRWESGDENPQTWRYRQHPALREAYKLAQGQADGAVIELRQVITLQQKVGA